MDQIVAASAQVEGALEYRVFVSEDETEVHVYEAYRDVEACLAQEEVLEPYLGKVLECVEFVGFWVFGEVEKTEGSLGAKLRSQQAGAVYSVSCFCLKTATRCRANELKMRCSFQETARETVPGVNTLCRLRSSDQGPESRKQLLSQEAIASSSVNNNVFEDGPIFNRSQE